MDQLVSLVAQKTGISESQARTATETVLGFLKSKLPPQFASQIDSVVSGSGGKGGGSSMGDMAKSLGGMLGK